MRITIYHFRKALLKKSILILLILLSGRLMAGGRPGTAPTLGITTFNTQFSSTATLVSPSPSPQTAFNVGNATPSGWDFTITAPTANVVIAAAAGGANPGGASDFYIRMTSQTSNTLQNVGVKSNDGSAFGLQSVYVRLGANATANINITGYKSGVAVSGAVFMQTGVSNSTTWTKIDVSALTAFQNVDEFRLTQNVSTTAIINSYSVDQIDIAVPLPLTLVDFSGLLSGNSAQLSWTTAREENTAYFEIQRGTDGINYAPVGKLPAAGNSSLALHYSYTDPLPAVTSPDYFYRLKMADLDGRFTYSPVLVINASPGSSGLSIYPNPFSQQVTVIIASPVTDKAAITVTDMAGRHVLEQVSPLQKGSNILPLSALSQLGKGLYLLTITTGQQKQTVELMKVE
ncbi:MAG TPA: T9SS type A sorting domain-containing protein [Puia sp.]|nr:T9SS type A sorting domain-containing protein [Puia sp.]